MKQTQNSYLLEAALSWPFASLPRYLAMLAFGLALRHAFAIIGS